MTTITLDKAAKDLAALIKRAREGEEIVITDGDGPGVQLAPVAVNAEAADDAKPSYRGRGILKGKIKVSDEDLFGPLPEDELKRWYGEGEDQ